MTDCRYEVINRFHDELKRRYSDTARLAGWSGSVSQRQRFLALLRVSQFAGGSVVDYGCGPGDLLSYLNARKINCNYLGLDMRSDMIDMATQYHGAHFERIEYDKVDFAPVDYVFANGIFQFVDDDKPTYVLELLSKMFMQCKRCLAVTFLSSRRPAEYRRDGELYYSPAEVAEIASSISGYWRLDHSYHHWEGDMAIGIHRSYV